MERTVRLTDGTRVPAIGLGTWRMGEHRARHAAEVGAVREALALGIALIDTAEMYGEGGAEEIVGEALAAEPGRREQVFVVSKFYPHHASARELPRACDRSRRRLGLDTIDLYLLHWPGDVPIGETVDALQALKARGAIARWGVSNFDVAEMSELWTVGGGRDCAANQVHYSLGARGIEFDLLPWQRERGVPTMAYSPIDQGALASHHSLAAIAERHGATHAQVALAWLATRPDVIAIPKSSSSAHLREIVQSARITLDARDLAAIDAAFAPPRRKRPLSMI